MVPGTLAEFWGGLWKEKKGLDTGLPGDTTYEDQEQTHCIEVEQI